MMIITTEGPRLIDIIELYGEDVDSALKHYPIYDEDKRDWLNKRILEHFYYREIAQHTPAMFIIFLERKLAEVMPSINPVFALLDNADLEKEYRTFDSTISKSSQEGKTVAYDFPQNQLSADMDYAKAAQTQGGTTDGASGAEHWGRSSAAAVAAATWVAGVNNALMLVFQALEPLFTQTWEDDAW